MPDAGESGTPTSGFDCQVGYNLKARCVPGNATCPRRGVRTLDGCRALCVALRSCAGVVFNSYQQCFLKRQQRRLVFEGDQHGTVSCVRISDSRVHAQSLDGSTRRKAMQRGINSDRLDRDWLDRRAMDTTWNSRLLIFTLCNRPFAPVAVTWHASVKQLGLERHAVIFALDAAAACTLTTNGLAPQTYLLGSRPPKAGGTTSDSVSGHMAWSISSTWRCKTTIQSVKYRLLAVLSSLGFDLLYVDADITWVASPLDALAHVVAISPKPAYGLAMSRGKYPFPLSKLWGATACAGIMFTYGMLPPPFWARLSQLFNYPGNEQELFNYLMLVDLGATWPERLRFGSSIRGASSVANASTTIFLCLPDLRESHRNASSASKAVSGRPSCSSQLPFTLLSFREFPRVHCPATRGISYRRGSQAPDWVPDTTLLHCITRGTYKASVKHVGPGVKHGDHRCVSEAGSVDQNARESCRMGSAQRVALSSPPPASPLVLTEASPRAASPTALTDECKGFGAVRPSSAQQRAPSLIWSFPGSGNTWVRILFELSTSVPTGSAYNDPTLQTLLRGEMAKLHAGLGAGGVAGSPCAHFSAVKVHHWNHQLQRRLCGGLVDSALILVRHPMPAIWAEVQRRHARQTQMGTDRNPHGQGTSLSHLPPNWANLTKALARTYALLHAPASDPARLSCAGACETDFYGIQLTARNPIRYPDWVDDATKRSTYLRFEALADPSRREVALTEALRFAGYEISPERVACALNRSDRASAHRSSMNLQQPRRLTAKQAFAHTPDVEMAVWTEVEAAATMLGYTRDGYT